jgi:hypothetical protein
MQGTRWSHFIDQSSRLNLGMTSRQDAWTPRRACVSPCTLFYSSLAAATKRLSINVRNNLGRDGRYLF